MKQLKVYVTGTAGSGKTTLAHLLKEFLQSNTAAKVELIDEDDEVSHLGNKIDDKYEIVIETRQVRREVEQVPIHLYNSRID